jgi:PAS domain S-box-containing protein
VVGVDPYYFANFYKQVDLGENSVISLFGRDGELRVRQSAGTIQFGTEERRNIDEVLRQLATRDTGNTVSPSEVDGVVRIRSFRALKEYPLVVVVGVSETYAYKELDRRIGNYLFACGLMSAGIILFIGVLLLSFRQRQRAEEILRESEERLQAITQSTQDAVLTMDPQGRISYWNPAATKIFGYSEQEALGADLHQLLAPERYHEAQRQGFAQFHRTGAGDAIGYIWALGACHKLGHEIAVELSLSAMKRQDGWYAVGIIRDITRRKQAEEELKFSQIRYQTLMEQSADALAVIDITTREVVEINHRVTEMLGYSLPADAPLYVDAVVSDTPQSLDLRYGALRQQRSLPVEMVAFRHKNGSLVHTERVGKVINIGGHDYLLASVRDMTEERRRQAEMKRDVEFARRVQRELLPKLPEDQRVSLQALYYPSNYINGDSYFVDWTEDKTVLRGLLIDVSGHGLATAIQTASINVLLREATTNKVELAELIRQINARAAKYFTDGAFAAMIGFSLDLSRRELQYVGAGITQFIFNGKRIEVPGMFVGLWEEAEFSVGSIPVKEGDSCYFLTDGFTDALVLPENAEILSSEANSFGQNIAALERLASGGRLLDDASGICLKIVQF